MHQFFHNIAEKKDLDAPNFLHLLAAVQLLIYFADAVSPSIRYLWSKPVSFGKFQDQISKDAKS